MNKKATRNIKKKRNKINWFNVIFMVFLFIVGLIAGISLGMKIQQMIFFEGAAMVLEGSNINIDVNETELVNHINETLIPELKEIFQDQELKGGQRNE